jgi:hypothetical protein
MSMSSIWRVVAGLGLVHGKVHRVHGRGCLLVPGSREMFSIASTLLTEDVGPPHEMLELQSYPALSQRRGVGWSGKDRSLRDADGVSVISQLESLCTTMRKRRRSWNGESCGGGMGMASSSRVGLRSWSSWIERETRREGQRVVGDAGCWMVDAGMGVIRVV